MEMASLSDSDSDDLPIAHEVEFLGIVPDSQRRVPIAPQQRDAQRELPSLEVLLGAGKFVLGTVCFLAILYEVAIDWAAVAMVVIWCFVFDTVGETLGKLVYMVALPNDEDYQRNLETWNDMINKTNVSTLYTYSWDNIISIQTLDDAKRSFRQAKLRYCQLGNNPNHPNRLNVVGNWDNNKFNSVFSFLGPFVEMAWQNHQPGQCRPQDVRSFLSQYHISVKFGTTIRGTFLLVESLLLIPYFLTTRIGCLFFPVAFGMLMILRINQSDNTSTLWATLARFCSPFVLLVFHQRPWYLVYLIAVVMVCFVGIPYCFCSCREDCGRKFRITIMEKFIHTVLETDPQEENDASPVRIISKGVERRGSNAGSNVVRAVTDRTVSVRNRLTNR